MTKYEREQLNILISYYGTVEDEIKLILKNTTDADIKYRLGELKAEIETQFDRLRIAFVEYADTVLPQSFKSQAYNHYMKIARRRGMGNFAGTEFIGRESNVLIAENIKMTAVESMEYGLSNGEKNIMKMLRDTQQALLDEEAINRAVSEGFEQASRFGGSRQGASKRLYNDLLKAADNGKFIEINGRKYDIKKYSKMVARTKIMEANNRASVATALEFGNDYVQASTHNTTCPICAPLEGKVYCVSGNDKRFPKLTDEVRFPKHPNCAHSYSVIFKETMERRGIDKYSDFSLGKTSEHPTNKKYKPVSERELE
jgi:hypothetical protein